MERRKRALVTGGATGIGRAAVLHLARAGYDVGLNYRSSGDAAREVATEAGRAGAKVLLLPCDVADDAAVRAMLREIDVAFGGLEVLINNAGTTVSTPPKDLDAVPVEEWDRVFAVNVRGLFLGTRAAVPLLIHLMRRRIGTGWISGHQTAMPAVKKAKCSSTWTSGCSSAAS